MGQYTTYLLGYICPDCEPWQDEKIEDACAGYKSCLEKYIARLETELNKFALEKELNAHYEAVKSDYLSFTVTKEEMKLYDYEKFIKEISEQEILNKKGSKPTKLALRAKELLERFK